MIYIYTFFSFIDLRERERKGRERHQFAVPLIYAFTDALMGDQAHNLGILGQHSNQLNYTTRAVMIYTYYLDRYLLSHQIFIILQFV